MPQIRKFTTNVTEESTLGSTSGKRVDRSYGHRKWKWKEKVRKTATP